MHLINAQNMFTLGRGGRAIDQEMLRELQFVTSGRILKDILYSPSSTMWYKDIPLSSEVS